MICKRTCQILNQDGKQCMNNEFKTVRYHGDSEIYDYHFEHDDFDAKWVIINVCKKHYRENFK